VKAKSYNLMLSAAGAALLGALIPSCALAQTRSFDIASEPMPAALETYAQATNRQILFSDEALKGLIAPPVQGTYTADEALALLLRGSGLKVTRTPSGVLVVRPAPARAIRIVNRDDDAPVATAAAATTAAPAAGVQLESVVVTATRREERLQNVPVSVSAYSQQTLQRLQLNNVHGLERVTPSLSLSRVNSDRTSVIATIRGLVQTDQLTPTDPAVGFYIDGVYVARGTGTNAALVDLERVEVLRGPQGTLFGRNTIGGAINLVPNKPNDTFGGWMELGGGNYDTIHAAGVLNLPVSDTVAMRLTVSHDSHSAFAHSSLSGAPLADMNSDFVRLQIRYRPNDKWDFLLAGDYTHSSYAGEWTTGFGSTVATPAATLAQVTPYEVDRFSRKPPVNFVGPFNGWGSGAELTITGDLGFGTFRSISAYRTAAKHYTNVDLDGIPFDILAQPDGASYQREYSQEVQLFGKAFDNRLDWIVGGYYFHERGYDHTTQLSSAPQPTPANFAMNRAQSLAWNTSYAAYAQATFNITQALRLTAGVRYTLDNRRVTVQNAAVFYPSFAFDACTVAGAGPAPNCDFSPPSKNFSYIPFTVGLDYKIQDTLLYAKFSRGFRSGGFNVRPSGFGQAGVNAAVSISTPFLPEQVNSYEIGAKSDLLDHHLRINIDAYQADYNNIQLTQLIASPPPATTVSFTKNAGTARIRGIEAEVTAVIGNLTLGASGSVLDAKYLSILPGVTGVTTSSHFQFVPDWSYSLSADYAIPVNYGSWNLHLDWNAKGREYFTIVPPNNPAAQQPSFGLLNTSVNLDLAAHPIRLTVWCLNLLDQKYIVRGLLLAGAAPGSSTIIMGFPGDPRTFGATVRYTF